MLNKFLQPQSATISRSGKNAQIGIGKLPSSHHRQGISLSMAGCEKTKNDEICIVRTLVHDR